MGIWFQVWVIVRIIRIARRIVLVQGVDLGLCCQVSGERGSSFASYVIAFVGLSADPFFVHYYVVARRAGLYALD